jgi:hypothetical protein
MSLSIRLLIPIVKITRNTPEYQRTRSPAPGSHAVACRAFALIAQSSESLPESPDHLILTILG